MIESEAPARLRVLVADEGKERVPQVSRAVATLGHEVIARQTTLDEVGPVTGAERPDVAMVILEEASERSLGLIGKIVREAACPVIAILDVQDRAFINEAAKRGIFAYISDGDDAQELQSSIDIALRRFAEYHDLEGAFGRRAVTERAKGILMERHLLDEGQAFNMLRAHARKANRKLVDIAEAVAASHLLLPRIRPDPTRCPTSLRRTFACPHRGCGSQRLRRSPPAARLAEAGACFTNEGLRTYRPPHASPHPHGGR